MKRAWLCVLMLTVMAVVSLGCNSDDDDSSATQGGAVATAFMTGGEVGVGYWDTETKTFPRLPGASGTLENSKLSLQLPDGYEQYLPLYVVIYDAELFTEEGSVLLQDYLFGVITEDDDPSKVYVSIFSTIAAHTYGQAIRSGTTREVAMKTSRSAVRAVFSSLGMSGSYLTPDNIRQIDPTTADPAVAAEFEKAQQAARMILGVGADTEGLTGLENAILGFADDVVEVMQNGGEYTAQDFMLSDVVKKAIGDVTPSEFIAANDDRLNAIVRATFTAGQQKGATPVQGQEAFEEAAMFATNSSELVALRVSRDMFVWPRSESAQTTPIINISFRDAGSGVSTGVYSVKEATGTLLFSTDDATFVSSITDQDTALDSELYIRVPGNATGTFTAELSNSDYQLRQKVVVTVVPQGTVSVSSVNFRPTSSECYLEMDEGTEEEIHVASGSIGYIGPSGTTTIPGLHCDLETVGSGNSTTFIARLKLHQNLVFPDFDDAGYIDSFLRTTDGTDWSTNSTEFVITTGGRLTPLADLKVMADEDMPFASYPFTLQILDADGMLLKSSTVNLHVLTTEGSDNIAQLKNLEYGDATWEREVDAGGYAFGATAKPYQLVKKFKIVPKTWRELAGISNVAYQAPAKAFLFTSPATERGGFGTSSASVSGHNMELSVPATTTGEIEFDANTAPGANNWLHITVGANATDSQLNYENVILRVWYGDDTTRPGVSSINSVKFKATEN